MSSTTPTAPVAGPQEHLPIAPVLIPQTLRKVPDRSKASEIGYVLCPRTNAAIKSESGIEHNVVLYLYSDSAIDRVMAQSARIRFTNADGKAQHHTLDLRASRRDHYTYGLLVKPDSKAVGADLRTFTKQLAAVTPKKVADELNYVTERDMPEHELRNAALILSCRRDRRTHVDAALADLAPTIVGDVSIADLCATLGGGRVAFRPVVRAIFYGTLECMTEGLLTPETIVRFSGSVMPDLDADGPIRVDGLGRINGAPAKPVKRRNSGKRHSYRKS